MKHVYEHVDEAMNMNVISINCPNCGKSIDMDFDKLQSYCGSCGSKLLLDVEQLQSLLIQREKEKTNQLQIKESAERDKVIERIRAEERARINKQNADASQAKWALIFAIVCFPLLIILGIVGLLTS